MQILAITLYLQTLYLTSVFKDKKLSNIFVHIYRLLKSAIIKCRKQKTYIFYIVKKGHEEGKGETKQFEMIKQPKRVESNKRKRILNKKNDFAFSI